MVRIEGVEKHKKGGLNCVLKFKTFFLKKLFCSGLKHKTNKEQREGKRDTRIYTGFSPKLRVRPVSLHFQRISTIISQDYKCSSSLARDFSSAQVTSNKRLLKLNNKNECYQTLDILSDVFTKYNANA
ncbi:hypothetical protein QL285_012534 [Trifolium repens]|nr:hypothetical protein QL285_012534 [Trifolium repens]